MRSGLLFSFVMHAALVTWVYLGLPMSTPDERFLEEPIFVDIVEVAETRNAPPQVQPQEKPPEPPEAQEEEPPAPPPEPEPVAAPEPEPEPQPAPEPEPAPQVAALPPEPEPEPEPEPAPPEPEPVVEPEPEPEPKQEAEPEPEPEPKVEPQPEPQLAQVKVPKKPKRKPKNTFDLTSVLKTLEEKEQKPRVQPKPDEPKDEKEKKPAADTFLSDVASVLKNADSAKFDPTREVTQLEIDQWRALIRRKVGRCWNPPVGAPGAEQLRVELSLTLAPDGSVKTAEVADTARLLTDRFYRSAAEAARRAVLNPLCNKFELPPDRYQVWKDMKFRFDPSELL